MGRVACALDIIFDVVRQVTEEIYACLLFKVVNADAIIVKG